MRKVTTILAISISLTVLVIAGLPRVGEAQQIYGCYGKIGGLMRVVSGPGKCTHLEIPLSWNTVGPTGPRGPQGVQGSQGPAGPGLTNLNDLQSLPCSMGNDHGTVSVSYESNGIITIKCVNVCTDGTTRACYDGPAGTRGVGACRDGIQTCTNTIWGPCQGEVLPKAEICGNNIDDDCNGTVDNCPPAKIVFLSSVGYSGNLGGLAGADAKCNQLANAAGIQGTFMAWLSSISVPGGNPAERFTRSLGPYVLVNGTQVASDWSDLTTPGQFLESRINVTEKGDIVTNPGVYVPVWSNTWYNGNLLDLGGDCNSWSSDSQDLAGSVGIANYPIDPIDYPFFAWTHDLGTWGSSGWLPCSGIFMLPQPIARLYCFEQ